MLYVNTTRVSIFDIVSTNISRKNVVFDKGTLIKNALKSLIIIIFYVKIINFNNPYQFSCPNLVNFKVFSKLTLKFILKLLHKCFF